MPQGADNESQTLVMSGCSCDDGFLIYFCPDAGKPGRQQRAQCLCGGLAGVEEFLNGFHKVTSSSRRQKKKNVF